MHLKKQSPPSSSSSPPSSPVSPPLYLEDFDHFLLHKKIWQRCVFGAAHQIKDWHRHILHLLSGKVDDDDGGGGDDGGGENDDEDWLWSHTPALLSKPSPIQCRNSMSKYLTLPGYNFTPSPLMPRCFKTPKPKPKIKLQMDEQLYMDGHNSPDVVNVQGRYKYQIYHFTLMI